MSLAEGPARNADRAGDASLPKGGGLPRTTMPLRPDAQAARGPRDRPHHALRPLESPTSVEALVKGYLLAEKPDPAHKGEYHLKRKTITRKPSYRKLLSGVRPVEDVLVLICGHGGRDQRCGIYGPVLQAEFET